MHAKHVYQPPPIISSHNRSGWVSPSLLHWALTISEDSNCTRGGMLCPSSNRITHQSFVARKWKQQQRCQHLNPSHRAISVQVLFYYFFISLMTRQKVSSQDCWYRKYIGQHSDIRDPSVQKQLLLPDFSFFVTKDLSFLVQPCRSFIHAMYTVLQRHYNTMVSSRKPKHGKSFSMLGLDIC